MAVPGSKPKLEVRAKVRIGEKRRSAKGKEYPAATDYFLSDCPEFNRVAGERPSELTIRLPFELPEDNFSTGLEWWGRRQKTKESFLACYTKGDGRALRIDGMQAPDDEVLGPAVGQNRLPIVCRARECPVFKRGDCKPMGRLQFFLVGGPVDSVYQLDTKAWTSIERLEGTLAGLASVGPLRGRTFVLSVAFVQKGRDRFPVLSLREASTEEEPLPINNSQDVEKAEALLLIERARVAGQEARKTLAEALDLSTPGWRDNAGILERIRIIGVEAALANLEKTLAEKLA